jgi:hypothetical protein
MEVQRSTGLDEPVAGVAGWRPVIQITARVPVAIEPVDGRKGIDSLVRLCQDKLAEDPFSGCVFVFQSRSGTAIRLLTALSSRGKSLRFPGALGHRQDRKSTS